MEDLKILNRNLYWETDWKDFLTRSRSIAVTDIWLSSDSDFSRRKNPLFWPKIHILRRLVIFKNLFNSDDGDDFSTYKIKAKYVFYGLFYVFLFNLNIVLIFCFHSKKIVNERHEYLISHKRNLQLTFMYNLQVWYRRYPLLPSSNIQVSLFHWSVFPHTRVFIKELSTNITSETSIAHHRTTIRKILITNISQFLLRWVRPLEMMSQSLPQCRCEDRYLQDASKYLNIPQTLPAPLTLLFITIHHYRRHTLNKMPHGKILMSSEVIDLFPSFSGIPLASL